jgi:dephospho-CoA kinase
LSKVFAIVGMCGSGKSIACDNLREKGWQYIRFGQLTMDSLKEKGQEINPENEKKMRERLRKEYGMGAFALLSLKKIEESMKTGNVVVDGLYSWSEYKILKEKLKDDLKVVHIYASPGTRYKRLNARNHTHEDIEHRNRRFSPEEAKKRDYAEIENIEKGGPIAMADYTIINESSLAELKKAIEKLVRKW